MDVLRLIRVRLYPKILRLAFRVDVPNTAPVSYKSGSVNLFVRISITYSTHFESNNMDRVDQRFPMALDVDRQSLFYYSYYFQ